MKTMQQFKHRLNRITQTRWLISTVMALALATALLGLIGCQAPHH